MADKEPSTSFEIVPTGERHGNDWPGGVGPTEGREWRRGPGGLGSAWHNPRPDLFNDRRSEGRRTTPGRAPRPGEVTPTDEVMGKAERHYVPKGQASG